MEVILLGIFIAMEIALLVITFTKQQEKSKWYRNRIGIRTGEIIVFLAALLLPQITWDFRFKMLFGILAIRLFTAGLIYAFKNKKVTGKKSKIAATFNVLFSILLITVSMVPAFLFTGYEGLETTGTYEVKQTKAILVDENRVETFENDGSKREVPIYFYYPETENAGTDAFPLVIFSHGAFGYYQSNTSTYIELASHGYIVISMDHPYHSFFTADTDGKLITVNPEFLQEVMVINQEGVSEKEVFELSRKWMEIRSGDMNFVLDSVKDAKSQTEQLNNWYVESEEVKEQIEDVLSMTDIKKIGLMGHSMGGATSVTLGRTRSDVDAVIDLDGTMLGEQLNYEDGIYEYYEEAYPVPLMVVDNEEHYNETDNSGLLYVNDLVIENAMECTHTYIEGSGHMNFTDLPLFSPVLASLLGTGTVDEMECILEMNEMVLQFFDSHLKN